MTTTTIALIAKKNRQSLTVIAALLPQMGGSCLIEGCGPTMAIFLKFVSEFQGTETRRNKLELPAGARDALKYRPGILLAVKGEEFAGLSGRR
jgi:hypothetical protein